MKLRKQINLELLHGMTQYSIRPERSAIRAQDVYFLHSTMPSVTCLRLSDVSAIYTTLFHHYDMVAYN